MNSTIKLPSAWIPVIMSLAAIAIVLIHGITFGFIREVDEGTAAHIWQILMAAQIPIILFFAIKWLPRIPKHAIQVLALQGGTYLISLSLVFFNNL